jgi:TonB-dependent starch-binding outer membrane protein SusC
MRKLVSIFVAFVLFTTQTFAQEKTVTGKVTDEKDGSPISGVSVTIAGTNTGTTTGVDGSFSLSVPSNAKVLIFSFVNYATQEVTIGTRTSFAVKLSSEEKALAEVVVVGYGTQQKKAFTGSASKINTKEFANLVTPSIDRQLAGRAPGLQVATPGGQVNTPARIRIRGLNSISQNLAPLIVVDGVPFITGNLAATTNSNALGDINPNDIENIEVLKDGAATAIFGSRAAGGVIMITTKKGDKGGRMKVNYDFTLGYTSPLKKFDLLNANDFVLIQNEKLSNAGVLPRAFPAADGTNTDWQSVVFNENAPSQNHNLSFSGGATKTTYFFSLNYSDQKGTIVSNRNTAYRVRFNFETEVNKYVKFGNNLTLSRQVDFDQNNGSNALSGAIAASLRLPPNVNPLDPANVTGYNIRFNPAGGSINSHGLGPNLQVVDDNFTNQAFVLNTNIFSSDKYRIVNNAFMEIAPVKGLKLRSVFNFDVLSDYSFQSLSPRHGDGFGSAGVVFNSNQVFQRYVWQNYANYNLSAGNHNFYLTAGHEQQGDQTKFVSANGSQISDIFFIRENLITGSASIQTVGGGFAKSGFESLFGRFNYDFDNKYFLQASIRRDGQSSLAPGKRYGVFPGGSVGWRVSQENFWQNSPFLSKIFNEVKLKASYAVVGNALGGFPYATTFGPANYGNIGGIALNQVGTLGLQWETNKKTDVGVEFQFLKGRYTFGFDYFKNDLDNLVLNVPTPPSAGVPNNAISQNIGNARNKGFEFSLGGDIVRNKNITWSFNANLTLVENKILSLYDVNGQPVDFIPNGNYNVIRVGQPINFINGLQYQGVHTANGNPLYINAAGQLIQHNIATNSFHFASDKNDPTLGVQTSLGFNDRANLGLALPTYFGGITNTVSYKGFTLDVLIRYSGGNKVMNITRQEALLNNSFQNNGKEILNRWTTPGQVTDVPRLVWGQGNNINQNGLALSRFVESGDFIRLQNINLSYNFNNQKISDATKSYVKNVRVFVQGQNLFVWTKYTGADPENASELGLDAAVSPTFRVISFGFNLGF